jgi:hypothetical protein
LVTGNVPLKEGSVTPAIVTVWPKPKKLGAVVVTVTTPADRETDAMLAGKWLRVSETEMFAAGKFDVLVRVMVYVSCAGVTETLVGPDIAIVTVGRFAVEGVMAGDGADSPLLPAMLLACTVKV